MHSEERLARLKEELFRLVQHWNNLAGHAAQKPLARKIISDLAKELEEVLYRRLEV